MAGGEAAQLREEVAVVLASQRRCDWRLGAFAVCAMTARTGFAVRPLAGGERLPCALLGFTVGRRTRQPGAEVTQRLGALYVGGLESLVHRRAVALRPRAITVDEVRELRDEIRLALACEGRNLARTVPPGLPSVTRGAVFQVQHHAVRHVRGEPRGLRGEVRSCGRRGQQRTQHQHGAARHPQSYVGVWHDRSAALSTGTAR